MATKTTKKPAPKKKPAAKKTTDPTFETVKIERQLGFTHSHNDELEVLEEVGVDGESR